jgi:hypothetical protein
VLLLTVSQLLQHVQDRFKDDIGIARTYVEVMSKSQAQKDFSFVHIGFDNLDGFGPSDSSKREKIIGPDSNVQDLASSDGEREYSNPETLEVSIVVS